MSKSKPNLYRNQPIPLSQLSPDDFEDFVYQSLVILGKNKDFEMQSGRQPSSDEGFDCTAKTKTGNNLICIQCKRYTDTLYTRTIVDEICKIAFNGSLDSTLPKRHIIITSGNVGSKLRRQLRQSDLIDIKSECSKLIKNVDYQKALKKSLKDKSIQPQNALDKYFKNLESLLIWSGTDFQNELTVIWSKLDDVLQKHFSLEVTLREHPRPDFNVSKYLKDINVDNNSLIELSYRTTNLPNNLISNNILKTIDRPILSENDICLNLKENNNIVISSKGGSGKSTTLLRIQALLSDEIYDIECIPVKINLRSYSKNNLDSIINKTLKITYGSWKSLPYKFIFLFDALDEVSPSEIQVFLDDLQATIESYSFALTIRESGINVESEPLSIDLCLSISPLSYRAAFDLSQKMLDNQDIAKFNNEYREQLHVIGFDFLSSPFSLSLTLELYKENKVFPSTIEEIIEIWILKKIQHDGKKIQTTNTKVNTLNKKYICDAYSFILYFLKIEKGVSSIPENDFDDMLIKCYDKLRLAEHNITRLLDVEEFILMTKHYEILTLSNDCYYSTSHQLISDYLISKEFSKNWKKHLPNHLNNTYFDIWLFSTTFINDNEQKDFLSSILEFDSILGAKVANRLPPSLLRIAENSILKSEQSSRVVTRSNAIYALGILGSDNCISRLRSEENLLDNEHSSQRERSLLLNGDLESLNRILKENESHAQAPIKFSGGTYDTWFSSPPFIITDIARSRMNEWLTDKSIMLTMSLMTIELFGDQYDINALKGVIEETNIDREFYFACSALHNISKVEFKGTLLGLVDKNHSSSHQAKRLLLNIGIKSNIDNEIEILLGEIEKVGGKLDHPDTIYGLNNLVDFIGEFDLNSTQIDKIIGTYQNLMSILHPSFHHVIWDIAINNKIDGFITLAEDAYTEGDSTKIHNALRYLSSQEEIDISEGFANKIATHFSKIDKESYGTISYYIKYFFKIGERDVAISTIRESLENLLNPITLEDIEQDSYRSNIDIVFKAVELLDLETAKNLDLGTSLSLKFLLIDSTSTNDNFVSLKRVILSKLDRFDILTFTESIEDEGVKINVYSFLLESDLIEDPMPVLGRFIQTFLSHHMYHNTINHICRKHWNDETAEVFLSNFMSHNWDHVNAQMFDKHINLYADLITKKQLETFESTRTIPINPFLKRLYLIWLELKELSVAEN